MDTIAGPTVDGMSSFNGYGSSHGIDDDFPSGLDDIFLPAHASSLPLSLNNRFNPIPLSSYIGDISAAKLTGTSLSSLPNDTDKLSYLFSPAQGVSGNLVDDHKAPQAPSIDEWSSPFSSPEYPSFRYTGKALEPDPNPDDMICTDIFQEHGVSPFNIPLEQLETIIAKYRLLYRSSTDRVLNPWGSLEFSCLRDLIPSDLFHKDIPFEFDINEDAEIAPLLRGYETDMQENQWTNEVMEIADGPRPQNSKRPPASVIVEESPRRRQRIHTEKWDEMQGIIKTAYLRNGNTLKTTMKILQDDFEFVTSYVYLFLLIVTLAKLYG